MMAELAAEKAVHSELREMARKMMKVQRAEIETMQKWRRAWYPTVRPFASRSPGMAMEELRAMSGNEFDLAFIDGMIAHHPGAIYLGTEAQTNSRHADLKALGKRIASTQKTELRDLRSMRDKLASKQ